MSFEFGKTYIVDVTEKGIIPREVFDRDRFYDKDHDDLDFLTDEEKIVVINDVLEKIRAEIEEERKDYPPSADEYKTINKVLQILDKYKSESEGNA